MGADNTFGETNFNPKSNSDWWQAFFTRTVPILATARDYAIHCHSSTNHTYDGHPYSFHLDRVYREAIFWIHLLPVQWRDETLAACWTHDVIEDCRQTYNNVHEKCGMLVADITFAVTNEKGRTRRDRENQKYFDGIMRQPGAAFVKLCDRLANVKHSIDTESRMLQVYSKEHPFFIRWPWPAALNPMLDELSRIVPDYIKTYEDKAKR